MHRLVYLLHSLLLPVALCSVIPSVPHQSRDSCQVQAASGAPFWLQQIKHQGKAPYNPNSGSYNVFRNVKDFGAVGDGVHDDTAAINAAIQAQGTCGLATNCQSSSVSPAVVYFPSGTYLVSTPIIPYYYSALIGDAINPPTLLATASFTGMAVIDANPYIPGGNGGQYFTATDNFFRSIRNFVIDVRNVPAGNSATGIHWQIAQATSLINIVFQMSAASNTAHQGIWMENGSGGFIGDLVFNGGKFAIWGGNQQLTIRNVVINNAQTAVYSLWNWGFTYQGITINNCQVGFDVAVGGATPTTQSTGSLSIIDAVVSNTQIFVRTSSPSNGGLVGSIVLINAKLQNVPIAVGVLNGATVLPGGSLTIAAWAQGNTYHGTSATPQFLQGSFTAPNIDASLIGCSGGIFGKGHPQYETLDVSSFVSAKDLGAKGDGVTDDTAALQAIFNAHAGCKIIFLDAGVYVVTSTLTVPAGTQIVGEAWSVLAGKGSNFQDQNNPQVVFRVGTSGAAGLVEITDVLFTVIGPTPGAIVIEWNAEDVGSGLWDSHIRLGGATGTNLQANACPSTAVNDFGPCFAAFLGLHITPSASAYFEGLWIWLADHDLDQGGQVSLYSGRGLLSESNGPVWLIGTAVEHHTIYQYNFHNAAAHYIGFLQTESPYYQPNPTSPTPFSINPAYGDPTPFAGTSYAWAVNFANTKETFVFGAGLYSFFVAYNSACAAARNCQQQILNLDSSSDVTITSLSTVGVVQQLSVNGNAVINQQSNLDGFASTFTVWTPS